LRSDDGLSLPALWGPGPWGEDALVRFASEVIRANPEYLALPPAVGSLRSGAVHALDDLLIVEYEQLPPGADEPSPALSDASLWFVYDGALRLVEIRNRTAVPGWSLLPPPLPAALSDAPPGAGSVRTPRR
jgi:hypothetical protein